MKDLDKKEYLLRWIYDRLILIHKENRNAYHMIKLGEIIKEFEASRESKSAVPSEKEFQETVREYGFRKDFDGNHYIPDEYYRGFRDCYEWFLRIDKHKQSITQGKHETL